MRKQGLKRLQNVADDRHPESGRVKFESRPVCTQNPKHELPTAPLIPGRQLPTGFGKEVPIIVTAIFLCPRCPLKVPNMSTAPAEMEQNVSDQR